ncbi:MAG: ABC transporter permease [Clostridiales bacterium]
MDIAAIALFLQLAVQMGTPILYGTLGGILGEKAGNLNLGVEGMMLMGAVVGFITAVSSGNPVIAILAAGFAGMIGALIYAVITVTFKGNQIVTGLALTIFGGGIAGFLGNGLAIVALPEKVISFFTTITVPVLVDIPVIGKALFQQNLYVMAAPILAILMYFYFKKTNMGLNHKMVGENPAAADASGISVNLYKYAALMVGGFLCGQGGAYLSLAFVPRWQDNITAGLGWIAVALVIFCTWNPLRAIFGAYFFGILRALVFKIQGVQFSIFGWDFTVASNLLDMLPYLMTIIVLVIITFGHNRKSQPPKWLGEPYFREDR